MKTHNRSISSPFASILAMTFVFRVARCGAMRMIESAALLVDEVLPSVPIRQWVLSVPYALR
jgi:hypothetical protein